MDIVAAFLLLLTLSLIVFFVTRPFFDRHPVHTPKNYQQLSYLLAERDRLLTTLQEMDSDQALGKIPVEDYPAQRVDLLQKGAEVMRKLDILAQSSENQKSGKGLPASREPAASLSDDELEDLLFRRRNTRKEKTAGFCPKCGKPVLRSDVFCPVCGSALK
jgi:hypothetical protein